ncbi:MAG: hypothetical protein HY010_07030 [Acidobacteria bacterium]|nr:hypothetical protein [Acidobacteriota bacterium]
MKILLLHSEDSPLAGPWTGERWDVVYDLGRSGWPACERWSRAFGCPVKPIDGLRDGLAEIQKVRELLQLGLGRLVDREGLDWWELTAILVHDQLETVVVLRKLANGLPDDAEVWITRDGFHANALRQLLGARLHVIPSPAVRSRNGVAHYVNRLRQLPAAQVVQILGDKFDVRYRLRRHLHGRSDRSSAPVVLVPSSYVNVSLMANAFAQTTPASEFLLVSTRSSGRLKKVAGNVRQEWLASYVDHSGLEELPELLRRWEALKQEINLVPEFAALAHLGYVDDFPRRFADGLAIRDAWLGVLKREPVFAVLCCDDSNPHLHIALLLAQKRGLPSMACHHGALDGRYLIKTCHADVLLAKGRMEADYLVNTCGVDASVVEIGAPVSAPRREKTRVDKGDWIVFFSEPYELIAERAEEIYRDILPGLVDLAARTGKKLIVKLHPSENLSARQSLAEMLLPKGQAGAIEWVTGQLNPELLRRMWFGVTVQSSVVVECAVLGFPCFLCEWLDMWPYGYVAQYRKFGVGIGLVSPNDIAQIPEKLAAWRPSKQVADDCWQTLEQGRFEDMLAGKTATPSPLGMQRS